MAKEIKKKQNSPANEKQEEEENMYMPVYVRVCVAVRALIDVHRTYYVHIVVLCINIYARHLIITNTHLAPALAIDHNNILFA